MFHKVNEILDPYIGQVFNQRYKVDELIGRGAFGRVFLITDEKEANTK